MSLLKSLQRELTCVQVPWVPTEFAASRRFINEIVAGEESDEYHGRAVSHFELYLEAMEQAGASVREIRDVVEQARAANMAASAVGSGPSALNAMNLDNAPEAARQFVQTTFRLLQHGSAAAQAAAFAFGREDAIPQMFRSLVRHLSRDHEGKLDLFVWYLERHIEVDGDDHGPMSLNMVADLCGSDDALWDEAGRAAEESLAARIALWDGVLAEVQEKACRG
jgi:hypothetical protein